MKKAKFKVILAAIFMFALLAAGMISPACFPASAENAAYSAVLDDLKKDPAFRSADYPANNADYSLNVIQIAESVDNELFVYVYQPSAGEKQLSATSINLSRYDGDNTSFRNYKLNLLNREGVFGKYVVTDFKVQQSADTRIYNIPSIFRAWDNTIDKTAQGGNTVSEVPYEVAKCYAAKTVNDSVVYECRAIETITVTDKYCGHLKYDRGDVLFGTVLDVDTDSFYVAFTTDRAIDTLLEADVYYVSREVEDIEVHIVAGTHTETKYGEYSETHVNLLSTTDVIISGEKQLLNFHSYTWKEIESVADFKKNNKLTQSAIDNLFGKKWVLRFANFNRIYLNVAFGNSTKRTEVSNVTVLRLKFETAGKTYNLGVVDNKQTPDPNAPPDNKPATPLNPFGGKNSFWEWLKDFVQRLFKGDLKWWEWIIVILAIPFLLLVVVLIIYLIPLIIQLGKGIIWLFVTPFKLLGKAIKASSRRREKRKRAKAQKEKNKKSEKDYDEEKDEE